MANYYSYVEKVINKFQTMIINGQIVFFVYNKERKEFYVAPNSGEIIYTIPEDKFTLTGSPDVLREMKRLSDFWENAETKENYEIAISQKKVKPDKRTMWLFETAHLRYTYIDNQFTAGLGLGNKTKKYDVYVAGANRPVLLYAADPDAPLLSKRIAIIFPFVRLKSEN